MIGLMAAIVMGLSLQAQYFYISNDSIGQNPKNRNTQDSEFPVNGGLPSQVPDNWNTIITGPSSSTWSSRQSIPFLFNFNGNNYNNYSIHPSGVLTFANQFAIGTFAPPSFPSQLPHPSIPPASLCYWGLSIGSGDYVVNKTFGTAPNRQHWIMFNSASSTGTQQGWVYGSIVLEETTNKIYFVNQRTNCVFNGAVCVGRPSLTLGIQINNAVAYQHASSPSYTMGNTGNDATRADNSYVEFYPMAQPSASVRLKSSNMPRYLVRNRAPFTFEGILQNIGSNTLTSYVLNYSVTGPSPASASTTISGQSVASMAEDTFRHTTAWTPPSAGVYSVKIWSASPNGVTDPIREDDTIHQEIIVVDTSFQRLPVYELFTSSTNPLDPQANSDFKAIMDANPGEAVIVKYPQNFPGTGDPYATVESVNRRTNYGINSTPRMRIDGGWDQNTRNITQAIHDNYYMNPSFLDVEADFDLKANTQSLDIQIDLRSYINYDPGDYRLFTAIVEERTTNNTGNNGETEFFYTFKKMLPDETGEVIGVPLTQGTSISRSFSYTFPGNYRLPQNGQPANQINLSTEHSVEDFCNLKVAVWIQKNGTDEVIQAVWADNNSKINAINAGSNSPLCLGDTLNLTNQAAGGSISYTYDWDGPGNFNSGLQNPSLVNTTTLNEGTYTLEVTDAYGCSGNDTIEVSFYNPPSNLAVSNSPVCYGDSILLVGGLLSNIMSGTWTGPASYASDSLISALIADSSAQGMYYINAVDVNGCAWNDSVAVDVITLPNTDITRAADVLFAVETGASYQWIDCGNDSMPINGATGQLYTPSKSGSFAVIVTKDGCADTSNCMQVVLASLDENTKAAEWTLFPNPNKGSFAIHTAQRANFGLYDMQSRLIDRFEVDQQSDISIDLPAGIYLIRNEQNGSSQKLIVE